MIFDVAIVGCGPVGALAANFLGRAGLKTLVIEREAHPYPLPRAVHLDHEMMRLFQAVGVVDQLAGDMRDAEGHLHVGADLGVIRYLGTVGRPRPFGWSNDYFFYQPELEDHLRAPLKTQPNVDLRLGAELVGLTQDADQVTLTVHSQQGKHNLFARWAIGCDGARSVVRKALGVTLDDLNFEEPWLVVDVEVEAPVRFPDIKGLPAEANLQTLSVMMCDPARPTTVVPGRGNHRRWEFMLLPGEDDEAMMRADKVAALLSPWMTGIPHTILRAASYRFHGLVAQRWHVGRVFLAGDAAHQTPPFFGQGMCHGMRDVANLAWKLPLVVEGVADVALLETYQQERDPHVRAVISAAVEVGQYICILDRQAAAARDAAMRERVKDANAPITAADLIPPIRAGVVGVGCPSAGQRFIQPWVDAHGERTLLDDVVGGGWRLFVASHQAQAARNLVKTMMPDLPITVVDIGTVNDNGSLQAWLDERQVCAALVRPDFYVFATAVADIGSLLRMLRDTLHLRSSAKVSA